MTGTGTGMAVQEQQSQVALKKLLDDFLNPDNKQNFATEFAWEDIYCLANERVWKFNPATQREEEIVVGQKIVKRQIKGTYYSPQEIAANKRYLEVEPHMTINRVIRQRRGETDWKVKSKVPEKIVSGETKLESNPNE